MNKQEMIQACNDDPTYIFTLIKHGESEVIEEVLHKNIVKVNQVDSVGNDVITRLLKAKQYDLVIEFMKKRNWDVNHKNIDGDTFGHILALDSSLQAVEVVKQLTKKKNYDPNEKNNKGETIFDRAMSNNYLCTVFRILEDRRFNDIDVFSFKHLFNLTIKTKLYGKYTKIANLDIIVDSLIKKDLDSSMTKLIESIKENIKYIKQDILNDNPNKLESLINNYI